MKKMVISFLSICLLVSLPGCCGKKKEMKMKKSQDMHTQIDIEAVDENVYDLDSVSKP